MIKSIRIGHQKIFFKNHYKTRLKIFLQYSQSVLQIKQWLTIVMELPTVKRELNKPKDAFINQKSIIFPHLSKSNKRNSQNSNFTFEIGIRKINPDL